MLSMDSSTESAANWLDNATTINGDPMGSFVNLEMLNLNPNNMTDMEEARYLLGLPDQREALSTAIPLTIIYALLLVTGCLGNLCTAIVIARPKNRYMHTATNYYLFSLAMSDFLFLITGLPDEIYALWQRYPYRFSETFCILRGYISEASTDASILTITAFTVERYVAICHPLWAHKLSQLPRVITNIIVIWMAAAIFAIPPAAQLGLIYFNSPIDQRILYVTSQCGAKKNIFDYMFITSAIFFFIIPMIIVTVLYILIAIELRKSSKMNSISSATMRSNGTSSMVHSVSVSAVNSSIVYGNQQDTESCQCHHRFPQTQTQAQAQAQQASSTLINRTPGLKQLSHHFSFSSTTKPPAALNTAAPAANSATCLNHHRYLSKSVHGSKWSDDRRKQAIRDNNVSCICSCHHCHCSVCVGATRENSSGCQDNGYDSMCHEDDSEYSVGRKCPKQLCTDAANTTSNNNKNNLRYNFNYPVKLTKDLTRSCMLGNIVTIRWNNRYIPKRNKTQECNNNIINHDNNNSKQHNRQACANNHRAVNHEACDVMHRGIIHNKHSFQNRHRFSRDNTRGCTNDTLNSSSKVSSVKQQQPTIDIFVQSPSSPSAAKCIASSVDDRNDYSQSNEECHKADERTLLEQTMQSERQKQRQRDNSELGHCDNGTILNEQMRQNSVSNSASINGSSESNAKNDDNNNANRGASSSMMMMTIPLKGADDGEQLGYDKDSAMPLVSSASEPNFEAVPSIKDHGTPKIAAEAPSIQMDALAAPISSRPQHHCCGHKHGSNSNIKLANHSCKRHPTAVNCCSNCNCVSCSNCGCCFAASKAGENIHPPQRHSRQSAVVTANCDTKLTMTRPPSACSAVASLISVSDRTSSHYEAGSAPPTPATSECYCQRTVPNQLVTRRSNAASSRKSVIRMLGGYLIGHYLEQTIVLCFRSNE
ncbi:Pyrokinin-1 receptor, partial [Fragariocoptes setiger]